MSAAWAGVFDLHHEKSSGIICAAILVPGDMSVFASRASPQTAPGTEEAARIPAEQLIPGGSNRALPRSHVEPDAGGFHLSS